MRTVIDMAREAGYYFYDLTETHGVKTVETDEADTWAQLERFAELVRADAIADEREACAKVCDDAFDKFFSNHEMESPRARYDKASVVRTVRAAVEFVTEDCGEAIRSREQK